MDNFKLDSIGKRMNWARKQLGKSFNDLAMLIGGTNANAIGTAFRADTLKKYYLNILCEKLFINIEWAEKGIGEPFSKPLTQIEVKQVSESEFMEAEFLPITAQAGFLSSLENSNNMELQKMLVPKEYDKGNYLVVEISGPSMDDNSSRSICDGDKLLIKEVILNRGDKLPIRNNLFVIVSKEGLVCKQILNQDSDAGIITCKSFNSGYQDYNINLIDIYRVFVVCKIVERRIKI
jgi:hypothetical protein